MFLSPGLYGSVKEVIDSASVGGGKSEMERGFVSFAFIDPKARAVDTEISDFDAARVLRRNGMKVAGNKWC